ncbi:PREDICTED: extensin-like [Erythranthe guttata]|uniref:extensin-like n=1 Tax=Erythranthe guttata TaxID=4155 RepID=UPI00064DF3A6|nr:PREDICTED: extensin-like [Erythranthe guttata]|eukprot:XP_012857650.1 PREDICTED: extensin-like [Erythranthe guttata]
MARLSLLHITILLTMVSPLVVKSEKLMMNSRKLDEQSSPPDFENKCGDCPCDKPCIPPPSPPPPSIQPPPSPTKKPPPSELCPPPPSSPGGDKPPSPPYIYINGPPGSVYPVYPYYSGGNRRFSVGIFPFLISFILWRLAF